MYIPPTGNVVNFDFSGAYTPPLGGAVEPNFGVIAGTGRRRYFLGAS